MSISAIQHHLPTEFHYDNACKNKHEKDLKSINSNPSVNIHNLISDISHIENSSRILNPSSTPFFGQIGDMAITLQLMLLFNFIHRSDITSFAYKENPLSIMGNDASLAKPDFSIENSHIPSDFQKNNALIAAIKHYLVSDGQLTAEESQDFDLSLKQWAKTVPLFITPQVDSTARMKRALMAEFDPRTAEHIKEHCAVEEEILNTVGENEGKRLLFQAQRAENPFRMIYDDTEGGPTPEARGAADGLNIVADLLTLGIKPLVGNLIANAKRREYYKNQGDNICAERFFRLNIAEIATSLDVDSIAFKSRGVARKMKPTELRHTTPSQNRAAYYVRNPKNGIKKEILLELQPGNTAIHTEGQTIFLKPTDKPNEFMTFHPYAAKPELLQRKVIVDEDTLAWRYADSFDATHLNVEVREGKKQIALYGEYYDLKKNGEGKFEVVLRKASGSHEYVPVYFEPLSKTWHMRTHNRHPVFTREQENIINTLRVEPDQNFNYIPYTNNNARYYGSGKIYRAEKIEDTSHYTWGRYIEMNGEIVPVKEVVSPGRGVHYEVYNSHYSDKEHYLVSWDGRRWVFERPTSVHVSRSLEKQITADMFTHNIDVTHLSSPDKNGLRWDKNNNSYLNINNQFIHVKKVDSNRFLLFDAVEIPKMTLRFKKNKFYKESINERLDNILKVGLSGKERKTALDLLKDVDGYTEASAQKLLSEYNFTKSGLFSDYSFVLEIKNTGRPPLWSKMFKKNTPLENVSSSSRLSGKAKLDLPDNKAGFNKGDKIGEGVFGEVFVDADDSRYLIKVYKSSSHLVAEKISKHETEMFQRYYGEEAAMHFVNDEGNSCVRMYRVPGKTLSALPRGALPHDAKVKFVDMIERLNSLGIIHQDLHSQNILWDSASESFFPIDISNVKEKYFNADVSGKQKMNVEGISTFDRVWDDIDWKKKKA